MSNTQLGVCTTNSQWPNAVVLLLVKQITMKLINIIIEASLQDSTKIKVAHYQHPQTAEPTTDTHIYRPAIKNAVDPRHFPSHML